MTNKKAKNNNLVEKPNKLGRPKGSPNKTTALLKDAILQAAQQAGDNIEVDGKPSNEGIIGYLKMQAILQPVAFMGLLGKVIPLQVVASVTHLQADVTDEIMDPEQWAKHNDLTKHVH